MRKIDCVGLSAEQKENFLSGQTFEQNNLTKEQWRKLTTLVGSYNGEYDGNFKGWLISKF